jgi:hypothetical protein
LILAVIKIASIIKNGVKNMDIINKIALIKYDKNDLMNPY